VFQRSAYLDWLKEDLNELIEELELSSLQKHFLRSRWLDQVVWMEGRANSTKARYYVLRLTTIVGSVIIPALVQLHLGGKITILTGTAFVVSLLVAFSAAIEGFMRYGEQWRHYRVKVEMLKSEGWQFFQLSGRYSRFKSHARAYPAFATWIERLNQLEVEAYITEVAKDREESEEEKEEVEDKVSGGAVNRG
jgi:hypothetical protein